MIYLNSAKLTSAQMNEMEIVQERKVFLFWGMMVLIVVMNTTMFNVALPTILADLSLTSAAGSWFVTGYSVSFAIASLIYSRLSDYIPIQRLLIIGLIVVGTASIIGYLSNHFYILLAVRVLQAAGAGAVPGLAMVLAGKYIPVVRRGKVMAFIGAAASLGFGIGPVAGGFITQFLGWNALFLITSIVLFFIPIFVKLLPKEERTRGNFDAIGALLTSLAITATLLCMSLKSWFIFFLSLLLFFALWQYLKRTNTPFIQPVLFKNGQFLKLLIITFAAFIVHFSSLFLMPIVLTDIHGTGAAAVGLIIFPGAILSALTSRLIGGLIDRFGNKWMLFVGNLLMILSIIMLSFLFPYSPYLIMLAYIIMSPAFSALTSSVSNEISRILPNEELGAGMGLAQLLQFIGGGFGVTFSGLVISISSGLSLKMIYQNVFLGLFVFLIIACLAFIFYIRKSSKNIKGNEKLST